MTVTFASFGAVYACEVCFSRVTYERALRDVISYHFSHYLDDVNDWWHANVNLPDPLQS